MTYRPNPKGATWNDVLADLALCFERWGVDTWGWDCPAPNNPGRGRNHWTACQWPDDENSVTVSFIHPTQGDKKITIGKHPTPADNLWAIHLNLDSIRKNELRGDDDVLRQFYALPAPSGIRDPWEVLGIPRNAPRSVINSAWRDLANKHHPDKGGDPRMFREISQAYQALTK